MSKLPLINVRWNGSEYRVDIPDWAGGPVYLAGPVEARIVDLEAQVEALKADYKWLESTALKDIQDENDRLRSEIARYESGRVALCEELAGKRELIAILERRLRAMCSHPRSERNEAGEPVCAECGLIAEEEIEKHSRTSYVRTTIEGGPCAFCGKKLRDHIVITDCGVKNACPLVEPNP